jgi:hypothetical protein
MTRSSGARWSASSPKGDAIVRLIGAIVLEQNDEWAIRRARYMTLETIAPLSDDPAIRLPGNRQLTRPAGERGVSLTAQGHDSWRHVWLLIMVAFFAEVPIRSKLRGPRRRSRTTDIFRRR